MSVKKGGEKRDDERTQQRADEDALQKSTDHCPVDEDEQKDDQKKHHGHQPHQKGSGTVEHPTQRDTAAGCRFRGCRGGSRALFAGCEVETACGRSRCFRGCRGRLWINHPAAGRCGVFLPKIVRDILDQE